MKVNVVMLTRGRKRLIDQTLKTLYETTDRGAFNLTLVVDEPSVPLRNEQIYPENMSLLVNWSSMSITGMVRNLGVYWAEKFWGRGDWLYLSDNDVYFTFNWLNEMIKAFESLEDTGLRLLGGSNHPFHAANTKLQLIRQPGFEVRSHHSVAGYSQLMRWSTWDKYGPLQANAPGVRRGEDHEFCQKIAADGGWCGSLWPEVVVACGVTDTFGQAIVGAEQVRMRAYAAQKEYRDLYWE